MIANELLSDLKKGRNSSIILKVDFRKAFDTVSWEYLDEIMEYMGFGIKWREMIHECLSGSKLAVLINGSPSKELSVGRGIRQGDPLSPFPFDIAVKGLSVPFNRTSSTSLFLGLQLKTGII